MTETGADTSPSTATDTDTLLETGTYTTLEHRSTGTYAARELGELEGAGTGTGVGGVVYGNGTMDSGLTGGSWPPLHYSHVKPDRGREGHQHQVYCCNIDTAQIPVISPLLGETGDD